jgi:hypothetical protein
MRVDRALIVVVVLSSVGCVSSGETPREAIRDMLTGCGVSDEIADKHFGEAPPAPTNTPLRPADESTDFVCVEAEYRATACSKLRECYADPPPADWPLRCGDWQLRIECKCRRDGFGTTGGWAEQCKGLQ